MSEKARQCTSKLTRKLKYVDFMAIYDVRAGTGVV